jgi:hypothetical protein
MIDKRVCRSLNAKYDRQTRLLLTGERQRAAGHPGTTELQDMDEIDRMFVTIVSGLPRSGTSLLMQMIAAGGIPALTDHVRQADTDNPRGYWEFEPVKQTAKDQAWLADAPGKVVKMVFRLLYDLPADRQYRVVFTQRKLDEVLASQRAMLQRQGKQGASLSDAQLARVFAAQVEQCLAWLARQPNFALLTVNYNELVRDPRPFAEQLGEFLGPDLDVAAMTAAVDPSLYRQRS